MNISIWHKQDIRSLDLSLQHQWFDLYNDNLEQEYGYDSAMSNAMDLDKLQKDIKNTYLEYLHGLIHDVMFQFYVVVVAKEYNTIVSAARLVQKKGVYYMEGLQTHKNYRRKKYALACVKELLEEAKRQGINTVYSRVRNTNEASLKLHKKAGFHIFSDDKEHSILIYDK